MPEDKLFDNSTGSKESEHFRKKERDLIEKLKTRSQAETERQRLSQATKITDEGILKDLHELGCTRETVTLLHLVPMVEVAWASGQVTRRERIRIFEAAQLRGITEESVPYELLTNWLDARPPDALFEGALPAIRAMLSALPLDEREAAKRDLVGYCTHIAAASGGILGFGQTICDAEWKLLGEIAAEIERDHQDAAKLVVSEKRALPPTEVPGPMKDL